MFFSVALSRELPPADVIRYPAHGSSDFPQGEPFGASPRPHRLQFVDMIMTADHPRSNARLPSACAVRTGTGRYILSVILSEIIVFDIVEIDESSSYSVISLCAGNDLSGFDIVASFHFLKLRKKSRDADGDTEKQRAEADKHEFYF